MYAQEPALIAWSQIEHPIALPAYKFEMGAVASVATGGAFTFKGVTEQGRESRADRQIIRHMVSTGWLAVPAGMPTSGLPIRRWTDDRPVAPVGCKLIQISAGSVWTDPDFPDYHLPEVYRPKLAYYASEQRWLDAVEAEKASLTRQIEEVQAAISTYTAEHTPVVPPAAPVAPAATPVVAPTSAPAAAASSPVVFPPEWKTSKRNAR